MLLAMFLGISFGSLVNALQDFIFVDLIFSYLVLNYLTIGTNFHKSIKTSSCSFGFTPLYGGKWVSSGTQLGSIGIKSALLCVFTTSFAIFSALLISSFLLLAMVNIGSVNTFSAPDSPSFKDTLVNIFLQIGSYNVREICCRLLFLYCLVMDFLKIGENGEKIKIFLITFI